MSKKKVKRTVQEYLSTAHKLAKFVPSLKKYNRRKSKLTRWEKGHIARFANALPFPQELVAVDKKTAKKIKDKLAAPGALAIRLKGTAEHASVKLRRIEVPIYEELEREPGEEYGPGDLVEDTGDTRIEYAIVTSNGRDFIYIPAETATPEDLISVAEAAFKLNPLRIYLWTSQGRAGRAFEDIEQFSLWLWEEFSKYQIKTDPYGGPEKWMEGVVALIRE